MAAEEISNKEARKQLNRFRDKVEEEATEHALAYLNITPMMDMMTILLVFLLKQFAVQQAAATSKDLSLPASSEMATRPPGVNITITQNSIIVEGDAVTAIRSGSVDPSVKKDGANSFYITPLVDILTKHANRLKKISALGGQPFDHTATVMVDKNTPYRLLSEILYSAGQAEFSNYRLAVIKKAQ